jgi:DNA topoisomerase-1
LRVLGKHPRDGKPVELFAGRYGPYVKHGAVNATVRDREHVDALTLDAALALLAEKSGKEAPAHATPRKRAAPKAATPARGFVPAMKAGRPKLATAKSKAVPKTGAKPTTKSVVRASAPTKVKTKTAKKKKK